MVERTGTTKRTRSARATGGDSERDLRQLLAGLTAVRDGDFGTRLPEDGDDGLLTEIATVFNGMVDQLSLFTSEVTRVAREVGTEGQLGGQAEVPAVSGTWKDLTDSVNAMAGNLTSQVRSIAEVTTAVAKGDLSQKITVDAQGEILELKNTVNTMVDQLSSFADEVTRVAREVGTEGQLGGQADVKGVSGTWRDLTDSVNFMAGNLTSQVRSIAQVTTAVARGDLSQKITVDARGEILELKNTVNTMVDQLSSFADEVTRVAREVGTEGQLGGQADVKGVSGTWRDLTDSVNFMAGNLTSQVRNISQVATAVAKGDLSQKITVEAKGEVAALAQTINTMVDTLSAFADEVTRVAREVGTEGQLGGQARVPNVAGTWKDLTDNVNSMADNLTNQVRSIAQVTTAVAKGDLSQKIRVDARGEILELKETINTMVDQLSSFADEVTRVAREVGTEGGLGGQATVRGVSGTWKDLTDSVNVMASNLTSQVRSIAQVATAVAKGDLSQKITVEAKGEVAALAQTINTMVDTLSAFADEVTRVAREVGTEGQLGGQARVPNVAGTWKDLTDNVNSMADNLTNQVRSIAQVTTAVAEGDLTRKIDVVARGEILALKTTINTMVDQLSSFAAEVTRVAREVGSEGRLGGQAEVEGVSGTWKRLTENVNELAGNLTRQVRAIAEVTSAVTSGDLTRSITVDAEGELADLKDNVNSMVESLRESTRANQEQDWLKTNLARLSGLMQGHRDLSAVAELVMNELAPLVNAQHGTFLLAEETTAGAELRVVGCYGHRDTTRRFAFGESLVGQAAQARRTILVEDIPPGYLTVSSSLGQAGPVNLIVLPIVVEDQVLGVIELASLGRFAGIHRAFLEQLVETIGVNVNTIVANARTDALLAESQRLATELQVRQEELQRSNAELEEKAELLAQQNRDIETKNSEIEQARQELEDRAQQLALASKYKSEFLANMSHELRTPLNSLLILAQLLSQNPTRNLTAKQVEYANVIHSAGTDLLQLINDILDLSKIEAGKMDVTPEPVSLRQLLDYVDANFRPLTSQKGLRFEMTVASDVPARLLTDEQRLRQVLRNLLSNAVKFTESGSVELRIERAAGVDLPGVAGQEILAFHVMDTGIGIAAENLSQIFDAFQQADGTTSRKYGGTGLGLSISREIATLLGGEIRATSTPDEGSTFTLYLPLAHFGGARREQPATRAEGVPLFAPHSTTAHSSAAYSAAGHSAAGHSADGGSAVTHDAPAAARTPYGTNGKGGRDGRNGRARRHLLVVEAKPGGLLSMLAQRVAADLHDIHGPVRVSTVGDARSALSMLRQESVHCVVLDLGLPHDTTADLLKGLDADPALRALPVLAHHSRTLSRRQEDLLQVRSRNQPLERLPSLDELRERITLHLSADEPGSVLPLVQPPSEEGAREPGKLDTALVGRKVLVVDDDVRNVFALTTILELHGMEVLYAENGRKGIEMLTRNDDVDLVLMDIMMPEMDGYAATAAIRSMPRFAQLPIIVVTAKAMHGDREKTLSSGASDYVTKPVDADELIVCMRRWLELPGDGDQ
ncbi:HAMP domain-containing protein [Microbispora hainanensis]|uniref:HAMP domain-containing protein n=1 Tax=Microbispora hainanensis TaxID=568844 RepID=UPI00324D534E